MNFDLLLHDSLLQIGQRLSGIRRSRNEKLTTVAKAVKISHGVISRIENGRYDSLSIELLLKLVHYYNIGIDELFIQTPQYT